LFYFSFYGKNVVMDKPRFIIELRSGIVAVYDTQHPKYQKTSGCDGDYPWTVAFWDGYTVGNPIHWEMDPRWIAKAKELCDLLNSRG